MALAPAPPTAEGVRRAGTASLIANIVVIFGFGLLSIPGAILAARARRLAGPEASAADLESARRSLRWSWLLLGANLLLWVLLAVLVGVIALSILAARG